jgi:3-hydroxyisobutyrate dehydrogenase/putative dehydrogenase
MASGERQDFDRVAPILNDLGSFVAYCGPLGTGQSVKLVNQLLAGIHIAAAAEALAYAESLGMDAQTVLEIVTKGAANSFMLEDRGGRMAASKHVPASSAVAIFVKDMKLVLDAAEQHSFDAPLARTAAHLYERAEAAGLSDSDDSGVIQIYRGVREG